MDSSQQRMLIYHLFRCNLWKQFTDASQQRTLLYCLFNFKISENSSRVLQVTDVNLSLVQFSSQDFWKQFMDSSQQRMLIYHLFRCDLWKQFTDASQQRMLLYCLFNFKTSENSSRVLQVMDVDLSLVQFLLKTSENSLWILPNNGC